MVHTVLSEILMTPVVWPYGQLKELKVRLELDESGSNRPFAQTRVPAPRI
jgi:hypothetical protein